MQMQETLSLTPRAGGVLRGAQAVAPEALTLKCVRKEDAMRELPVRERRAKNQKKQMSERVKKQKSEREERANDGLPSR